MAKIQIKSEKITPFGGFFPIMDAFDRVLGGIVDSTLGLMVESGCEPERIEKKLLTQNSAIIFF